MCDKNNIYNENNNLNGLTVNHCNEYNELTPNPKNNRQSGNTHNQSTGIPEEIHELHEIQSETKSMSDSYDEIDNNDLQSPIFVFTTPPLILTRSDIEFDDNKDVFQNGITSFVYKKQQTDGKNYPPNSQYRYIPDNIPQNTKKISTSKSDSGLPQNNNDNNSPNVDNRAELIHNSNALPNKYAPIIDYNTVSNLKYYFATITQNITKSQTKSKAVSYIDNKSFARLDYNENKLELDDNYTPHSKDQLIVYQDDTKSGTDNHTMSNNEKLSKSSVRNISNKPTLNTLQSISYKRALKGGMSAPSPKQTQEFPTITGQMAEMYSSVKDYQEPSTSYEQKKSIFHNIYETWMRRYMVQLLKRSNEQDAFLAAMKSDVTLTPAERETFLGILSEDDNLSKTISVPIQKSKFKDRFKQVFTRKPKKVESFTCISTREILEKYEVSSKNGEPPQDIRNEMNAYFDIYVRDYLFTWNRWILLHLNHIHLDHVDWMKKVLTTNALTDDNKTAILHFLNGNCEPLEKLLVKQQATIARNKRTAKLFNIKK